ncbi:glycerophosphodiester phosphodiesterase [Kitasatospora sp. McL0602]|uniref:glycerophosphodiester phosphodiesterase n=1 Tax=Kitasatospora sp. McL0602 TaxID=3439530 RepID=UPI003F8871EA
MRLPAAKLTALSILITALIATGPTAAGATATDLAPQDDAQPTQTVAAKCGSQRIAGHRGSPSSAAENTMASFKAAVQEGADWLETDVLVTKDGVPVLFHDPTVDRVTNGKGRVQDFTYEELSKLRVTVGPGPSQPIPKLAELLDYLLGTRIRLLMEIKEIARPEDAAVIARMAADSGILVDLYSFYTLHLRTAHNAAPQLPLTLIQGSWYAEDPGDLPLTAISLEAVLATRERVDAEHARHRAVYGWIVDDAVAWQRLVDNTADVIITDTPGAARTWLDHTCSAAQRA